MSDRSSAMGRDAGDLAVLARYARSVRVLVLAACGIFSAALVIVNSGGFNRSASVSATFGGLFGLNAQAQANKAQLRMAGQIAAGKTPDPQIVAQARAEARSALARDLLLPEAWRTLALSGGIGSERLDRISLALLEASTFVSRRDVPTNVLLFRHYASTGRTPEAFRQLDMALRRSSEGRATLMPLIVRGLADDAFRASFVDALSSGAAWRDAFFEQLAADPPDDISTEKFVRELDPSIVSRNREKLALVASALVKRGRYEAAGALSSRLFPDRALLIDGGFEGKGDAPPLTWSFQSSPDYDAAQGSFGGKIAGRSALYIRTLINRPIEVARQIVFLEAGEYTLGAIAGDGTARPVELLSLVIACAGPDGGVGEVLTRLDFERLAAREARAEQFSIPRRCGAQWLLVMVTGATAGDEAGAWIDDVTIRELSSSTPRV